MLIEMLVAMVAMLAKMVVNYLQDGAEISEAQRTQRIAMLYSASSAPSAYLS
jgi:hypothetical protein